MVFSDREKIGNGGVESSIGLTRKVFHRRSYPRFYHRHRYSRYFRTNWPIDESMEQFEQLLTCAICLDRYRNPKLLPCQHSFCMEPCMDGLVDYVRRQVKCPECRAEHRIPYQGVQAFPTNVTLQRFLELHIEITGELPDPTSGQTMERCGVCSEKSYCSHCVHCDKKCCAECKDAHMDILRREITRINSQVRRGLHRLQDALALVEKNTLGLQTNCTSVSEEIDEFYRRLTKALKDRTDYLRNEVDRYLGTELRGLVHLKENLELEIANIQSNCDLAEAHINENVPWDDAELLDAKELFLRTVEFIRNFEYEAGDYSRRVRFMLPHEPNQMVLHLAGYGELNIKPETGSGNMLGGTGGLAPPGGQQGLMRSKSDHRLASQYRQQEDDRTARNRYVPDYEYETPEYEAPRNKSRYRSRFMRQRDGEDSDGDSRAVRFTGTQPDQSTGPTIPREKVLDTEDAGKGPLSGIFRLTDSPRVMLKLQECERVGKKKKEEVHVTPQPQPPKPQVQVRKAPAAAARQVSEDDEISRIKKQNKNAPSSSETTTDDTHPPVSTPTLTTAHSREPAEREREPEEPLRRPSMARRTSAQDSHPTATRSASSDSSTGSESSTGSGIRSTGAPFTAEEMKQKYLSKAPATGTTTTLSAASTLASNTGRDQPLTTTTTTPQRPFQSRFLGGGNRAAPTPLPAPVTPASPREEPPKKEEDDDDETTSSSEETDSETEEESETENPSTPTQTSSPSTTQKTPGESAMARTDIGPLLARSAEARRGSKEESPSTRYTSSRGSPAHSTTTTSTPTSSATSGGYTSRFVANDDIHHFNYCSNNTLADIVECEPDEGDESPSDKSDVNNIVLTVSDSSEKKEIGASYKNSETDEEDERSLVINVQNCSVDTNKLSNASSISSSISNDAANCNHDETTLAPNDTVHKVNKFDGNGWLVDSPESDDEKPRDFSVTETRGTVSDTPVKTRANEEPTESTEVASNYGWLLRNDDEEESTARKKVAEKLIAQRRREKSPTLGSNGWLIDSSDAEDLNANGADEAVASKNSERNVSCARDAEDRQCSEKNDTDDDTNLAAEDHHPGEDKESHESRENNNDSDDVTKMNEINDEFDEEKNNEDEDEITQSPNDEKIAEDENDVGNSEKRNFQFDLTGDNRSSGDMDIEANEVKMAGEYSEADKTNNDGSENVDESEKLASDLIVGVDSSGRRNNLKNEITLGKELSKGGDDLEIDNDGQPETVDNRTAEGNELLLGAAALPNAGDSLIPNVASEVNQSVKSEKSDESLDLGMQMQMVTTVFCVSILCYSVLINLLFV